MDVVGNVVRAWLRGERGFSPNLQTDGTTLFSYGLPIARQDPYGILVKDYTASGLFVSKGTSRHVNVAIRLAGKASVIHPNFANF